MYFRHAVIDADCIVGLTCHIYLGATGGKILFHRVDDLQGNVFFFDLGTVQRPSATRVLTTVSRIQDNGVS